MVYVLLGVALWICQDGTVVEARVQEASPGTRLFPFSFQSVISVRIGASHSCNIYY